MMVADPNWTLESIRIAQGLFGTLVGGGLGLGPINRIPLEVGL